MLAAKLKNWRQKQGLSVYAVAEMLKVTPSAVSNWEMGIRHPHKRFWKRIMEITDGEVTIDDLLEASHKPVEAR